MAGVKLNVASTPCPAEFPDAGRMDTRAVSNALQAECLATGLPLILSVGLCHRLEQTLTRSVIGHAISAKIDDGQQQAYTNAIGDRGETNHDHRPISHSN